MNLGTTDDEHKKQIMALTYCGRGGLTADNVVLAVTTGANRSVPPQYIKRG